MDIGGNLRLWREEKKLSQGDIEKRTGLLRCYISRVENGHTVPSVETLEKMACALDMSLYQLLFTGGQESLSSEQEAQIGWGSFGQSARYWGKLKNALNRMSQDERELILYLTQKLASRKRSAKREVKLELKESPKSDIAA